MDMTLNLRQKTLCNINSHRVLKKLQLLFEIFVGLGFVFLLSGEADVSERETRVWAAASLWCWDDVG